MVRWVRERQPYLFLREEFDPDGPVFVYAMRDEGGLTRWLLSWGAAVEVLEPPALAARLTAEARAVLLRHATEAVEESSKLPARTVSGALP
jgi:predicted DNA-binding transcriptional regulator YafY